MPGVDGSLEQMNQILDYIRTNLRNIRNTWGDSSPQHQSAVEVMERALVDNARRLMLHDSESVELMAKMKLNDDGED